jgi:4-hydroxythreonine-4-phosphate dehydrogenase
MHAIGFDFPGQTEFFAHRAGVENFAMCLTGGALTVALVTAHVPLKDVATQLTEREIIRVGSLLGKFLFRRRTRPRADYNPPPELLLDADRFDSWCSERMIAVPNIAVAGLNPHAGESGNLGREEIEIIKPAVKYLHQQRPGFARFSGPISPDTVFHRAVNGEFDGVLCMYHDQGLIPLKLHAFDSGVNVTLGLPFPRTSPDHGTAFEIAGRGRARANSMIAAIQLAS